MPIATFWFAGFIDTTGSLGIYASALCPPVCGKASGRRLSICTTAWYRSVFTGLSNEANVNTAQLLSACSAIASHDATEINKKKGN
jgi:hypothetical protein